MIEMKIFSAFVAEQFSEYANLFLSGVHRRQGQICALSRLQKHSSLAKPRQRNAPNMGEVS